MQSNNAESVRTADAAVHPTPTIDELLHDPSTPYWLRHVILLVRDRDPVDVLSGIEVLRDVLEIRVQNAINTEIHR
jgi:hypothetical protein